MSIGNMIGNMAGGLPNGLLPNGTMNGTNTPAANSIDMAGTTVYPIAPNLNMDRLIYRPEGTSEADGGLLSDDGLNRLRNNFAGGLLAGAQYDPFTNRYAPVQPSGVYTANQDMGQGNAPVVEEEGGDGAFTLADLMSMQASLNQGNFGNQDVESVFSNFTDAGKGTFDVDPTGGGIIGSLFFGTTADGQRVPMDQAEYKRGGRKGEPISKALAMSTIRAALSLVDESGGSDGPGAEGDDGGGSGSGGGF